jgi:hypothetical protein
MPSSVKTCYQTTAKAEKMKSKENWKKSFNVKKRKSKGLFGKSIKENNMSVI